jgi:hypothetical protein
MKVPLTPSPASDFVVPELVVELPDAKTRDGLATYVRVGKLEVPVLAPIMEGLPVDAGEQASEQASLGNSARRLMDWYVPATQLIKLSCIEPQFYFDPADAEPSKANGAALSIRDIAALFNATLRVSGWTTEDDDTADLRRFPDGSNAGTGTKGGSVGGAVDGAGKAPKPAVAKVGEWPALVSPASTGTG